MTVEQMIELLEREYPQALVLIEPQGDGFIYSWNPIRDCALFHPHRIQTDNRNDVAIIHCDRPDC